MNKEELLTLALSGGKLMEDLRAEEIALLAGLMTWQQLKVAEGTRELGGIGMRDELMILAEGEIEISALVNQEPVSLRLAKPGDLARIVSFVGGESGVSARIEVKRDSTVLLLSRASLESLLPSRPLIPYFIMRNLVRHTHAMARRVGTEKAQLNNYLYAMQGRF